MSRRGARAIERAKSHHKNRACFSAVERSTEQLRRLAISQPASPCVSRSRRPYWRVAIRSLLRCRLTGCTRSDSASSAFGRFTSGRAGLSSSQASPTTGPVIYRTVRMRVRVRILIPCNRGHIFGSSEAMDVRAAPREVRRGRAQVCGGCRRIRCQGQAEVRPAALPTSMFVCVCVCVCVCVRVCVCACVCVLSCYS